MRPRFFEESILKHSREIERLQQLLAGRNQQLNKQVNLIDKMKAPFESAPVTDPYPMQNTQEKSDTGKIRHSFHRPAQSPQPPDWPPSSLTSIGPTPTSQSLQSSLAELRTGTPGISSLGPISKQRND